MKFRWLCVPIVLFCLWLSLSSNKDKDAEAYYTLGKVNCEKGLYKASIVACNRALAIKPDYAEVYIIKGTACNELGQ